MTQIDYFYIPVNPEPWKVGPLSLGRNKSKMYPKIGADPQLRAFQDAVRDELANPALTYLEGVPLLVQFFFWRRLDDYETESGKRHRKHAADATNLQKATEDALQGILFANDRDVRIVSSAMVAQGANVTPGIGIALSQAPSQVVAPLRIMELRNATPEPGKVASPNDWM